MVKEISCEAREFGFLAEVSEVDELRGSISCYQYSRGENIVEEGTPIKDFHVIREGLVKMGIPSSGDRDFACQILGPGDLLEWHCLLSESDQTYEFYAEAIELLQIAEIPPGKVREIIFTKPTAVRKVIQRLSDELHFQYQRQAIRSTGGLKKAFTWLLLHPRLMGNGNEDSSTYTLRVTERTLAELLDCPRERIVRYLNWCKRRGVVSSQKGQIKVGDRDTLEEIYKSL